MTIGVNAKKWAVATDAELVSNLGNDDAFEELYHRYHSRVFKWALDLTKNASDAEDVTQEVFVQVFKKGENYRGSAALTTWLYRITKNQVLMLFRKSSYKNEQTSEKGQIEYEHDHFAKQSRPSEELWINLIMLNQAVRKLPRSYRIAVFLYEFCGWDFSAISVRTGWARTTTPGLVHQGRKKLRILLGLRQAPKLGRPPKSKFSYATPAISESSGKAHFFLFGNRVWYNRVSAGRLFY